MKYYFFRDKDNEMNLLDDKTYHAGGYVKEYHEGSNTGKDLEVVFFDPFEACIKREWRALGEVELFEVSQFGYELIVARYDLYEQF